MIAQPQFLMTPEQHREWARLLFAKGKPEKARRHEELARVIEKFATAIATERVRTGQN
jgi:hypothetical protein